MCLSWTYEWSAWGTLQVCFPGQRNQGRKPPSECVAGAIAAAAAAAVVVVVVVVVPYALRPQPPCDKPLAGPWHTHPSSQGCL